MKNSIQAKLNNAGMTASELIERLQECDGDAIVMFTCSYGDYGRTQQALFVEDLTETTARSIVDSAYSQSGLALVDDDDDFEYYCQKCEAMRTTCKCHKCGSVTVDEDGEPASGDELDDEIDIVVLS